MNKEIQKNIIESSNQRATEEEFIAILRTIAPGTNFRSALDGSLKAGKGALIVIENEKTSPLFDGGFRINIKFTPQRLIELCKMDGAIILSNDTKRINFANVLLTPSSKIPSNETGTRHKAAERAAKQAGTLTIAISERRHEITLFYKNLRYVIVGADELLRKANENIQLLEKQRELFDSHVERLDMYELGGSGNLHQAISVIQKGRVIMKIAEDLSKSLIELGKESTLLKMRLKEITLGVEKETDLVIKDYTSLDMKKSRVLLKDMSYDSILNEDKIANLLGYESSSSQIKLNGWRLLSRTSLSDSEIAALLKKCGSFEGILKSDEDNFKSTLDEERAKKLKQELSKIRIGM